MRRQSAAMRALMSTSRCVRLSCTALMDQPYPSPVKPSNLGRADTGSVALAGPFPSPPNPAYDDPFIPMRERMSAWVRSLQQRIVDELESYETSDARFLRDAWTRPQGGDGMSCVIQGGETFEKAGVGVSVIHGKLPPAAVKQMRADHGGKFDWYDGVALLPFVACGISLIVHPRNPFAPTVQYVTTLDRPLIPISLNYRYFEGVVAVTRPAD